MFRCRRSQQQLEQCTPSDFRKFEAALRQLLVSGFAEQQEHVYECLTNVVLACSSLGASFFEAPPLFTDGRSSSPRGEVPPFLRSLANALQRCVDANQAAAEMISPAGAGPAAVRRKLTPFHGVRAPPISIAAYLERIAKYAKCSPVCFVMAATYLERLAEEDGRLRPSALNVHRLLVTGVLLAAKLMDDHYFNNAYYAKIGGVALEELNALELHMMQLLDHRLRVSALTVTQALQRITSAVDASPHDFSCLFGSLLPPVPEAGLAAPDSAGATVRQQRRQQEQQNSGAESCMAPQPVVSPVSIGIQAF